MTLLQQMTQEDAQRKINEVVGELRKRGLHDDRCPRCRTTDWTTDFLQIPVAPLSMSFQPNIPVSPTMSAFVPVVLFTCINCGYMVNHSLRILGIDK